MTDIHHEVMVSSPEWVDSTPRLPDTRTVSQSRDWFFCFGQAMVRAVWAVLRCVSSATSKAKATSSLPRTCSSVFLRPSSTLGPAACWRRPLSRWAAWTDCRSAAPGCGVAWRKLSVKLAKELLKAKRRLFCFFFTVTFPGCCILHVSSSKVSGCLCFNFACKTIQFGSRVRHDCFDLVKMSGNAPLLYQIVYPWNFDFIWRLQ